MATASTPTVPSFRPAALSPVLIYRPWDKIKGSEFRRTGVDSHPSSLSSFAEKLSGVGGHHMRPSSSIGPPLPPLTHPSFFSFSLSHGDFSSLFPRETTELEGRIGHVVSRSTAESKIKESCWLGTGETVHVRPCQFLLEGVYVLSRPCIFFSPPRSFLKSKTLNLAPSSYFIQFGGW